MQTLGFSQQSIGDGEVKAGRKRSRSNPRADNGGTKQQIVRLLARILQRRSGREWLILILKIALTLISLGILTLLILWWTLPNIDDPSTMFPAQSTVILDRNGVELYRLFTEQDRTYVKGDEISPFIKDATIAIEDERFFSRSSCFDVIGFTRAVLSQIAPRYFVRSGGSTLTQQFAGNALVGRQRSLTRKVRELMLSCQLEQKYDKDQLLELYLNWIPYGSNGYGIEQASKNFFGIRAADMTLAQSAVLAALPQRPSYFAPSGKHRLTVVSDEIIGKINAGQITTAAEIPDAAVQIGLIGQTVGSGSSTVYVGGRTDQVLANMTEQGKISEEQKTAALEELQQMRFAPERQNIRAPHFVLSIERQVASLLGLDASDPSGGNDHLLEQGGFRIETTLDWNLQQIAEKVVAARREDIQKRFGANNVALLAVAPGTREILAYVGNSDFSDDEHEGKIDMVTSPRQPGSSFKPFTYLAAFEQGYGPGSVVYDVPTKFGEDQPQNYDGTFWGLTDMRHALAGSRNVPAVKAFFLGGGEETVLSVAGRMGISSPAVQRDTLRQTSPDFSYGWPLAIGAAEVPLTEMVTGYATIADGGMVRPLTGILKITDKDGNIRYLPKETPAQQVIDARLAAQITSILSDVSARPADNAYWQSILSVPGTLSAAKTGTSNKCLERGEDKQCTLRRPESTWTIGYTPNIIAGVWVGNATSQSLFEKADGLTIAAPIWHDFMAGAQKIIPNANTAFAEPSGLSRPLISRLSGQLASACTPVAFRRGEVFLDERVPTTEDPACVLVSVDRVTGLLSSPACPVEAVTQQAFFLPKSEIPDRWPLWERGVAEWAAKQMEIWTASPTHTGSQLPLPLPPTKECDPSLTPGRLEKPSVSFTFPLSGDDVSYPAFKPQFEVNTGSPITAVRYDLDDKPVASFDAAPFTGIVRLPKALDLTASHTLTVTVTDTYFNTATDTVSVRFTRDDSAPYVSIISPAAESFLTAGEEFPIRAEAEAASGIDRVQFYLDGKLLTTRRDAPFELNYAITEAGTHVIRVTARSTGGTEGEDQVTVEVR
ncbi:MAG: penicillin-binding protein [Candidatus Peribacteraceae bacterium]|nr:penicillin-binding protein [Candidatus Peribacteraceae bacterium]